MMTLRSCTNIHICLKRQTRNWLLCVIVKRVNGVWVKQKSWVVNDTLNFKMETCKKISIIGVKVVLWHNFTTTCALFSFSIFCHLYQTIKLVSQLSLLYFSRTWWWWGKRRDWISFNGESINIHERISHLLAS